MPQRIHDYDLPVATHGLTSNPARATTLISAHHTLVRQSLRRYGVDTARTDDAAQDVFVIVARKIDEIRSGSERSYLLSVALRVAANYRKARATSSVSLLGEFEGEATAWPDPEHLLEDKRRNEALVHALLVLPDELRQVFVSYAVEEMTIPQIAERCCTPIGTIASRLRRARQRLRRALHKERTASVRVDGR